jgi:hypothetical protein
MNSLQQLRNQEASLRALLNRPSMLLDAQTQVANEIAKLQPFPGFPKSEPLQIGKQSGSNTPIDRISALPFTTQKLTKNPSQRSQELGLANPSRTSDKNVTSQQTMRPAALVSKGKPSNSKTTVASSEASQHAVKQSESAGIKNSNNPADNTPPSSGTSWIANPRFPASISSGNLAEKNDIKSNFWDPPKKDPEPLVTEEIKTPWYEEGEGLSLRKKEAAIKNGKARRNDSSNIGNSNAANYYYAGDSKTTATNSTAPSNDLGQKENGYILNADGTFSPASFKPRGKGQFKNEEKSQLPLVDNAAVKSLTSQNNLIDMEGLDLSNGEALQKQEPSLVAKLGLQPKIDSIEQYLANLLPSESGKRSDISTLIDIFQKKRLKKPLDRELSTVDPKKPEQIKRLILSTDSSGTQAQISLWDKLIAWLGIKR